MGFWICAEIDWGKTSARAAKIVKKSLAGTPMRPEVHRATAPHLGIWSSIGADVETSQEASKLKPPPQFRCWPNTNYVVLTTDSYDFYSEL
jgi:hypothetical protein